MSGSFYKKILCLAVLMLPLISWSQEFDLRDDTTPPELTYFTISPDTVDVTDSSAVVDITIGWEDDISGLEYLNIYFYSPSGGQSVYSNYWAPEPSLGDTVTVTMTIEQYAEEGTWSAAQIYLQDLTGNSVWLDSTELANIGYPTDLEVISEQDTSAPEVTYFDFSPDTVNVTDSSAVIDVTIGWVDMGSGLDWINFWFYSPSGEQSSNYFYSDPDNDLTDTVTVQMPVDQYSEVGMWTVNQLSFSDVVGNTRWYSEGEISSLGFPTQFFVESFQDTTSPELTWFSFSPDTVNVTDSSEVVDVTVGWTEDLAGLRYLNFFFYSPSGGQYSSAYHWPADTSFGDTVTVPMTIDQYSEMGLWTINQVYLQDRADNGRWGRNKFEILRSHIDSFRSQVNPDHRDHTTFRYQPGPADKPD